MASHHCFIAILRQREIFGMNVKNESINIFKRFKDCITREIIYIFRELTARVSDLLQTTSKPQPVVLTLTERVCSSNCSNPAPAILHVITLATRNITAAMLVYSI